jgi:putative ABC transport system substrate-binding protein
MEKVGRREFVGLLGGAVAWPAVAAAQSTKPRVGFVNNGGASAFSSLFQTFRRGLGEAGFADSQVDIEDRWAEGDNGRLAALVQDLVQHRVDVIVATGG